MDVCRFCGSTRAQARADARVLGFREEFDAGLYDCCQVVAWADEQWLAWAEAAEQDGTPVEVATAVLEFEETEPEPILVRIRKRPDEH